MFTVTERVFGHAADGRTILLFTPGMVIGDDDARRAGLLAGTPGDEKPTTGLVITDPSAGEPPEPQPPKALARMKLAELRDLCAEESIDPGGANTRPEFIAAIEAARAARTEGDAESGGED